MIDFLLHVLSGAAVGFAIGLTGVGGGSLMTPLLLGFGYSAPVAIGTDLLYAAITKTGGVISQHRRGNIDWKVVLLLASGSLPATLVLQAFLLDSNFQDSPGFEALLTRSLGVMLIVTATMMMFRGRLRKKAIDDKPGPVLGILHRHRSALTLVMGVVLGICVTLSSVGAGAFCAAILLILYSKTTTSRIIGTDIAHAVPLTFIAGMGYLLGGYVDLELLVALLVGSLPAIHLGSRAGNWVPDRILNIILTSFLLGLGIKYSFF